MNAERRGSVVLVLSVRGTVLVLLAAAHLSSGAAQELVFLRASSPDQADQNIRVVVKVAASITLSKGLAKPATATGLASLDQVLRRTRSLRIQSLIADKTLHVAALDQVLIAEFPDLRSAEEFVAQAAAVSSVAYAEIDRPLELFGFPEDPLFPLQWHLNNGGQKYPAIERLPGSRNDVLIDSFGTAGADISAASSFDINPTTVAAPIIAIIDTGVDIDHPDLAASIWRNPREIPGNGRDDDHNGYSDDVSGWDFSGNDSLLPIYQDANPRDPVGHGSHCAGIVAAVRDNELGIAGICPQARIMAIKIWPAMLSSIAAEAIIYAANNGADVISMSWGTPYRSQILADAIDHAYRKGVFLVAAMGNTGITDKFYPAVYDQVIAVGATDSRDLVTTFSTRGSHIDICAPGESILSLRANATDLYGRSPSLEPGVHIFGSEYYIASGTSMSAPMVAAAAGWLKSLSPGLLPELCAQRLYAAADDLLEPNGFGERLPGWDLHSGWGRLNLGNLIDSGFAGRSQILSPGGHEIIAGRFTISAMTATGDLHSCTLEFGEGHDPTYWSPLTFRTTARTDSIICDWDLTGLLGPYTLRLRSGDDNVDFVTITVVNEPIAAFISPQPGDTVFTSLPILVTGAAESLDSVRLAYRPFDVDTSVRIAAKSIPIFGTALTEWSPGDLANGKYELILSVYAGGTPTPVAESATPVQVSSPFSGVNGWRRAFPMTVAITPTYADLDADGHNEIILGTATGLLFFNLDGTFKISGVPLLPPDNFLVPPVVCDLDDDAIEDLVAVSQDPSLIYLISSENGVRTFALDGPPNVGRYYSQIENLLPVLFAADMNADGHDEIVFRPGAGETAFQGLIVLDCQGNQPPGNDVRTFPDLVSVADLSGDRALEIYTLRSDGLLQQFHRLGELKMYRWLGGGDLELQPTNLFTGDVDRDGRDDLIVSAHVVWKGIHRGHTILAFGDSLSWKSNRIFVLDIPAASDPRQPVLGDLDGDGRLEEVLSYFDATQGFIYAIHDDGKPVVGDESLASGLFATTADAANLMIPLVVNIDGQPGGEVVAAAGHDVFSTFPVQRIYAWNAEAEITTGWPMRLADDPHTSPARLNTPMFGDFDRDGQLDLMVVSTQRELMYTSFPGVAWDSLGSPCPMWRYNRRFNNMAPRRRDTQTGVDGPEDALPLERLTASVYPNPFNAEAVIEFSLPADGAVDFRVYNILGQVVELR